MDSHVNGIIPVLQTPLKYGEIDRESLTRHVNWLLNKGVAGLWVLGTGSEDMHLTFQQRVKVARTVCHVVQERIPVFLGCGFYSFYDTEHFIESTADLKKRAYHYMPYHPLLSWDRLAKVYQYLANSVPIWGYSSANWSRSMPVDFVKRIKDAGVKGIKFSSQRTSDMQKILELEDSMFQAVSAVATQFLICLQMGFKASTTSLAGVNPDLFNRIYDAFDRGQTKEAKALQKRVIVFSGILNKAKKDNFLSGAEEKAILQAAGIYETREMTFPYRHLSPDEAKDLIYAVKPFYGRNLREQINVP